MSEDSLGSGVYLDKQFDFSIDGTGDIRTTSGSAELEKDLAFQLAIVLEDILGQRADKRIRSEIEDTVVAVAQSDLRVQDVDEQSLRVTQPSRNEYRIFVNVIASGEEQELVFDL